MASRREDSFDRPAPRHAGAHASEPGGVERSSVDPIPDAPPPDLASADVPAVHALRRLDLSSSVSLLFLTLLLLPISFGYASLLAFPFGPARNWLVIGFFVLGLGLLVRPVEAKMMSALFKVRKPTEHELQRLEPIWSSVLSNANVDGDQYVLAVDNSAAPNASAIGGHVIAVTLGAMQLSDHELEGILAHELGHHLGFHPLALTASFWLSLPLIAVGSVINWLLRMTRRAALMGWIFRIPLLTVFTVVFGLLFGLFARILGVVLWFTHFIVNLIGRSSEYTADQAAVQLGFGPGLLAALETSAAVEESASRPSALRQWMWSTHPPLRKRIQRIQMALATADD